MSELTYLRRLTAKRHVLNEETGCWEWQQSVRGDGYGASFREGRMQYAHRVYYQICVGPIPEGMELDHLCNNRRCVNPDHLEPVTQAENQRRRMERKTHCLRGHPYEDNVSASDLARGFRRCLACRREVEHPRRKERMAA